METEALFKACKLDPKNVAYRYALGLVALAQGDFQRATGLLKAGECYNLLGDKTTGNERTGRKRQWSKNEGTAAS